MHYTLCAATYHIAPPPLQHTYAQSLTTTQTSTISRPPSSSPTSLVLMTPLYANSCTIHHSRSPGLLSFSNTTASMILPFHPTPNCLSLPQMVKTYSTALTFPHTSKPSLNNKTRLPCTNLTNARLASYIQMAINKATPYPASSSPSPLKPASAPSSSYFIEEAFSPPSLPRLLPFPLMLSLTFHFLTTATSETTQTHLTS